MNRMIWLVQHFLRQRQLDIARTGRQIDHQNVQRLGVRAPCHILQHLEKRFVDHRAAPDERLALFDQKADPYW